MAGLLGVKLEKPGFYALGGAGQQKKKNHLKKAVRIMKLDTVLFALMLIPIILSVGWVADMYQ